MRRRTLLLGGLCAPLAGLLPRRVHAADAEPHDLMPAFWAAYDSAATSNDRVAALEAGFFAPHRALYRDAGLDPTRERIARWLPAFDAIAGDVRRLGTTFPASYARHAQHFREYFPDFDRAHAPIYLLPSLFAFDGHLQPAGGRLPLFIGPDGIVRYHGAGADLSVFLDHESFHLYQAQVNPDLSLDEAPPVYVGLWIEGAATWVSERLNPGAPLLHVLLDDPALAAADAATLRGLAAAMLAALDSTADEEMTRFFSAGYSGPGPARGGYLVGLHVARAIGAHMPLAQVPRIPRAQLRGLVREELVRLAG